jgi:hypothetical protein
MVISSAFDVGWPIGGVDLGRVLEERHHVVQVLVTQMKLRHLPAAGGTGGLALDPGLDELGAATLVDVAELGREVGAFAEQCVATDAVVVLPEFLACRTMGECPRSRDTL